MRSREPARIVARRARASAQSRLIWSDSARRSLEMRGSGLRDCSCQRSVRRIIADSSSASTTASRRAAATRLAASRCSSGLIAAVATGPCYPAPERSKPQFDNRLRSAGFGKIRPHGSEPDAHDAVAVPARDSLARKTFVVTSVAILTVAVFLALWKLKVLIALLFLSFMLASAMRPGVERMVRFRIPRIGGVLAHYAVVAGLIALFLWFIVPNLLHQVDHAIGNVPQTSKQLGKEVKQSTGIKHEILVGLQNELKSLPRTGNVAGAAVDAGRKALEILVGIFFVLAAAAYWIYERERAEDLVVSLLPK